MESPDSRNGVPNEESTFTASDYQNYMMGLKDMAAMQPNPLLLNLMHCDDPELNKTMNKMNMGKSDQFRSRKPPPNYKKPQHMETEALLNKLNSIDFAKEIEKEREKMEKEKSAAINPANLKDVHIFNMPPTMQVPDSDDEEPEDLYHEFEQPPGYKFQRAQDFLVDKPLVVVSREEWGAVPPLREPRPPKYPIKNIVVTYKSETSPCFSREECMRNIRDLQKYHMETEALSDIPFNFMVGHDGTIYEGRGWNAEPSRSLESYPEFHGDRLDVAYFGDYRRVIYPVETNSAIIDLVQSGAEKGLVHFYCDFTDYREGHPEC